MQVQITQDDIDQGRKGDTRKCPMARALTRKGLGEARVIFDVSIGDLTYRMPRRASDWIDAFDGGLPVMPASFRLTRKV